METPVYQLWEDIVKQCPDSFVLLENPVLERGTLTKGILRYKNKSRKRVFEKAKQLGLHSLTVTYTEGARKEKLAKVNFVLDIF